MNKLLQLRDKILISGFFFSVIFLAVKSFAFGGWPFHLPELEGGVEVTLENERIEEEQRRAEEERSLQEQKKPYPTLRELMESERKERQRAALEELQRTGIV